MGKKSYFHKRFDKLAVLYANAIIVNQDCIKEKISYQNEYKKLEKHIESYKRDLTNAISEITRQRNTIDTLYKALEKEQKCADSSTD
jgi:viroplasmin and RNaseH domain-containing protein